MLPAFAGIPAQLEWLFECSWQASLLVLLVVAVQAALRRPLTAGWRYALWWIVLGRLLIPVPPASPWSLFNLLPALDDPGRSAGGWSMNVLRHSSAELHRPGLEAAEEEVRRGGGDPGPGVGHPAGSDNVRRRPSGWDAFVRGTSAVSLGSLLTAIWATGVLVVLGRLLFRNLHFARRVRTGMRPAHPRLRAQLDACRIRMRVRRPVELLEGDVVPTPAIYGLLRTRLLLPRHLAERGSSEALDHVFLHELAHLRRGDPWVHGLTRLLQALHWFNPMLAWGFRRLRADRELATDALALEFAGAEQNRAYGLTILGLLETWSGPAARPGGVGMLEDHTSLERRIRAIANFRPASRWAPLSAILVALLAAVSWTGAQPPRVEPADRVTTGPSSPPVASKDETTGKPMADPNRPLAVTPETPETSEQSKARERPGRTDDVRNPFEAGNPAIPSLKGREKIRALLESIRLPEIRFDRITLEAAVRRLKDLSKEGDPAGHGVNFFFNPSLDPVRAGAEGAAETGEALVPRGPKQVSLGEVILRLDPPLRDVSLLDVLEALTASAEVPIHFVIEDYAVVFMHGPPSKRSKPSRNAIEVLKEATVPTWPNETGGIAPSADPVGEVELLHQYAEAVATLDDLLTRYRGQWPAVIEARRRVEALRARFTNGVPTRPTPR